MGRKKKTVDSGILETTADDNSFFSKTIRILEDRFGEDLIESLSKSLEQPLEGISTGSLGLDYIICPEAGGMPRGQTIEFWGQYSTGKSTLALGICANATANKEYVVYVDAEGSLSPKMAVSAGVLTDYFYYIRDIDARKAALMVESLMKTGEVGVVVIDSLPAWKPIVEPKKGEDDADFTKSRMAEQSSFLTQTIMHLARVARVNNVVLVLLNQARENLSGYGSSLKPFGGKAIEHIDSVRIRLTGRASSSTDRITDPVNDKLVGQYTTALADKNKTAVPMQEAKLPLFLGRGVNPYMELAMLSQKTGIVEGAAGRFKFADTGEAIAYGINAFAQKLFDDTELYSQLRRMVIEKLGINYPQSRAMVNSFHDEHFEKRDKHAETEEEEKK